MSNTLLGGIVVAIILVVIALVIYRSNDESPATVGDGATISTFTASDGSTVRVGFGDEEATLNGLGYDNLVLTRTEAASGARYESTEEGVVVWNRGNGVTIYRNGEIIFTGTSTPGTDSIPTATTTPAATSSAGVAGNTWTWLRTTSATGTAIAPEDSGAFTIQFSNDGRVTGTTDCNGFSGTYTYEAGVLRLGQLAMTRMFCEGSQESEFIESLQSGPAEVLVTSTGQLTLFLSNGATILFGSGK